MATSVDCATVTGAPYSDVCKVQTASRHDLSRVTAYAVLPDCAKSSISVWISSDAGCVAEADRRSVPYPGTPAGAAASTLRSSSLSSGDIWGWDPTASSRAQLFPTASKPTGGTSSASASASASSRTGPSAGARAGMAVAAAVMLLGLVGRVPGL